MPDTDTNDSGTVAVADVYREQYAHFRAMNDILYRVPPLFSVAIGGLWFFGAAQMHVDKVISVGVFLFAGVLAVSGVFVMRRFGAAFRAYLANLNKLDGAYKVSLKPENDSRSRWNPDKRSTVQIVQILLWVAFGASVVAAIYVPFALPPIPAT